MSNRLRFFIPIEKINKDRRTVSGWATTEKIDKQNEIVDYEASKTAFDEWHGNIREMHEAKAVGKAIGIEYDDETKRIYVTAKISKGAEDTWIKVKDGTLTGFSIGGQTIDKVQQIVKDDEETKQITRITKYRLNELSLVDNPANPEASFELVKSDGDGHLRQTSIVEDSGDKKVIKYTGGDTKTMALSKQVLGKLSTLLTQIDKIVKQDWEDPNAEVGTAKETPEGSNESHEDVSAGLGKQEGDWEDPNTEVAGSKDTPAGSTDSEEDVSAGVKKVRKTHDNDEEHAEKQDDDDDTEKADMDTDPDSSLRTQEEEGHGAAPVKKRRKLYYKDADGEYHEMKKQDEDEDDTEKADMASNPDSNLRTQEEDEHGQANLATKRYRKADDEDEMDKQDEDEDTEKQGEDEDEEETMKTRKVRKVRKVRKTRKQYTAEGQPEHMDKEDYEEDTEKQDNEDDDTEKTLVSTTLKKIVTRLDRLEKAPLPRKYRLIEKTPSAPTESEELQKSTDEVMAAIEESRRTGKPLPPAIEAKRDRILNKMIDKKFGQDLRKV